MKTTKKLIYLYIKIYVYIEREIFFKQPI